MTETVEIREDSEQEKKCLEVLELLVAAGYFRARIKGLENFDKVVGGLVWCIETCEFDVDVLLFQEDWSIGKKIVLTEKIVTVLQQMQCPHSIEPHQIQGLDFIHIFPVIQWLVTQVLEIRRTKGNTIRQYSTLKFNQLFRQLEHGRHDFPAVLRRLDEVYAPKRKFRLKVPNTDFSDPELCAVTTLLEFGFKGKSETSRATSTEHLSDVSSISSDDQAKINVKTVTSLLSNQSGEIQKAAAQYSQLKEEFESSLEAKTLSGLKNSVDNLKAKKMSLESRLESLQGELTELQLEKRHADTTKEKLSAQLSEIVAAKSEGVRGLTFDEQSVLQQLQSLVVKNEMLKKEEANLKSSFKAEMEVLIERNKTLAEQNDRDDRSRTTDGELNAYRDRISELRIDLAEKSRLSAVLERKLDDVPSRYELDQYQKRFFELENQIASEYSESQQFVTMYNTLLDQKSFIEREITLLESILEMTNSQLMDQMGRILQGVRISRSKIEQKLKDQQAVHDRAKAELHSLQEQYRHYNLLVREMKDEMNKNEALVAKTVTLR